MYIYYIYTRIPLYLYIISLRVSFHRQVDADHGGEDGDENDVSVGGLSLYYCCIT